MPNSDSFKKLYEEAIDKAGGVTNVKSRVMIATIYFALFFRVKKGVESIEIHSQISKDIYKFGDISTSTGISNLRIPAHSCFILKSNPYYDSLYRAKETAQILKKEFPGAKLFFLYDGMGQLTNKVIREAKKEKSVEIWEFRRFLEHIERIKRINDQIEKFDRDWHDKREFILDCAKSSFRENKCSLFLGAGVSIDAGGPTWDDLLYRAIKKNRKRFTKKDFNKLYSSCGQSPIIMGRYIAPDKKSLDLITDYIQQYVLYKGVDLKKSELIKAICEFVETDKVESIITYNYDDLVETAIKLRGYKQAYSVVAKSRNTSNELPVYHVHGLIPHNKSEIASFPVLSEKDYHDIYRESYHWSNIEQLHALDRNSCFFIGLSMTDPNLRRLLDFSYSGNDNEIYHYAFLKRDMLFPSDNVEKNKQHFDMIEQQLERIGVWVIWYEQYKEVPQMIRKIIAPMNIVSV